MMDSAIAIKIHKRKELKAKKEHIRKHSYPAHPECTGDVGLSDFVGSGIDFIDYTTKSENDLHYHLHRDGVHSMVHLRKSGEEILRRAQTVVTPAA